MLVSGHDDLSPGQISVVVVAVNTGVKDWKGRQGSAKEIRVDAAERENPSAKEMPPEDYPCPALDWQCPGQLINMIGSRCVGDAAVRSLDMLGCKHEYLHSQLKSGEGRTGGESPASSLPTRRSTSRTGAASGCSPRGAGATASAGGRARRISLARGTWPATLRRGASERLCGPADRFRQASLASQRSGRPDEAESVGCTVVPPGLLL